MLRLQLVRNFIVVTLGTRPMGYRGPVIGKRPDKIVRENAPAPTEPSGTETSAGGVARWWESAKGYGAIETEKTAP